jgi:hypothetical protein
MAIEVAFMVAAAHAAIKGQVARINALNVYPVPDGDTGTNMLLTLESALKETSGKSYATPEEASKAGARAALMGARGNSGVILSQMIRGACEVLADRTTLDAETFALALDGAREMAYSSVREPVEGTMLTVVKDAAHAALETLVDENANLSSVVRTAAEAAHDSVRRTPELLGVLREAGVVDAGGLGVAVILDGLYACVTGQEIEVDPKPMTGHPTLKPSTPARKPGVIARSSSSMASTATRRSSRSTSTPRAGASSWWPTTPWSRSTSTRKTPAARSPTPGASAVSRASRSRTWRPRSRPGTRNREREGRRTLALSSQAGARATARSSSRWGPW